MKNAVTIIMLILALDPKSSNSLTLRCSLKVSFNYTNPRDYYIAQGIGNRESGVGSRESGIGSVGSMEFMGGVGSVPPLLRGVRGDPHLFDPVGEIRFLVEQASCL
ncbi:hypothetical protein [Moorena sp. SIO4G3]|uniref:hypothetical protein n=1 Tax=Moorena sp. SIO4G3 TaxID=2607821 RepID=UPI0014290F74|nr:hypothetical protein [Moorena sp. SIO4G3]NEO81663.1 hypothetical protein [Moorena sp. SIO4G3]